MIEMRDGVKLFTAVYSPKDKSKEYPILMVRTPYSSAPYGEDKFAWISWGIKRIFAGRFHLRTAGCSWPIYV